MDRLKAALRNHGIDVVVSLKPENSFYLSGFNPIIYSHPVVAVSPVEGDPTLLLHALRDDHARQTARIRDIRLYASWGDKKTMGPNWLDALIEILREKKLDGAVVGLELDYIPAARFEAIRAALPKARFANVSALIEHVRYVKDPHEIALTRKAAALSDRGMEAALAALRAGGTEREISIEAMRAMNELWTSSYDEVEVCTFGTLEGGAHNGLWCWTLSGERVLFNADNPINRHPQSDEIAVILIWTVANGMHAENERAVAIGDLSVEKRRAYDAVLTIRERVQNLLRPGAVVADIYAYAREQYLDLGYAQNVPGRIGHGIGIGAHEHLSIDESSKDILQPGMIITFEPGLRAPAWGGLQHSDTTLITDTGFEFLTTTERGFIQG
jgi:Xaa-Pro dipeptidase